MSKLRYSARFYATLAGLMTASVLTAASGYAAKGGHSAAAPAPCTMSGNVVYGTGLPTGEVINFMITDGSGTWGFVLGFTNDGNWSVNVPAPTGTTKYEFVSRTFGANGSKYNVFQSCSA
jgi:hypothetical protein